MRESSLIASHGERPAFSLFVALKITLRNSSILLPAGGGHELFAAFLSAEKIPVYLLDDGKLAL